jgi:predicted amidohydrolase
LLGYLLIDYSKAHPIPGVDTRIVAGPNKLQWAFSRFGRIGVGIGYDFNFPSFISQASMNQIALMLQPDASWGPVARY